MVAAPASTGEASALLAAAQAHGLAVVPRGSGTRLGWGAPPRRCDLVIDTLRLDRVVEHAAGDLVVRVQAGVTMARLAEVLAAAGQRLALDLPPGTAVISAPVINSSVASSSVTGSSVTGSPTVGGMLATGAAGPLRLRYGTPRDLLIGVTVVRADGTVATAGGKVVKNVAGYDLGKLYAGSYGTLGLITEAMFRLHPLPSATAFVIASYVRTASAVAAVAAAAASDLAPAAVEIDRPFRDGLVRVGVLLEGDPDGVAERAGQLREVLGAGTAVAASAPPWWDAPDAARPGSTVIRVSFWAAALAGVLAAIDEAGRAAGLDPAVSGSAAAGVLHVVAVPDAAPAAVAEFLAQLRAALGRRDWPGRARGRPRGPGQRRGGHRAARRP